MLMVMSITANGKTIRLMDMVYIIIQMELVIKVNG